MNQRVLLQSSRVVPHVSRTTPVHSEQTQEGVSSNSVCVGGGLLQKIFLPAPPQVVAQLCEPGEGRTTPTTSIHVPQRVLIWHWMDLRLFLCSHLKHCFGVFFCAFQTMYL